MPVYLIRAGETGPVKIGWTGNINKRFTSLQIGHYEQLRIIRIIPGNLGIEGWLHDHFAAQHLRGEWFRFHADMLCIEPPDWMPTAEERTQGPRIRLENRPDLYPVRVSQAAA